MRPSCDVARKLDTLEVGKSEVEKNDFGFGLGAVDEGACAGAKAAVPVRVQVVG
jgi:hypothetical protein